MSITVEGYVLRDRIGAVRLEMIDVAEVSAGLEVRCDEHTGFHTVNSFAPKVSERSVRAREEAASIRVHFVSLCVYRGGNR